MQHVAKKEKNLMAEAMLGAQIDMNYGKWLQAMWIIKCKEIK